MSRDTLATLGRADGVGGYRWAAADARATVLLRHGHAEHSGRNVDHHAGRVPALVARGYDVRAFDLEGHGRSQGARGVTDVGRMADAHVAARSMLAGRPLFLFGHSLGGLVTALSATRAPEGLAGVVLSGAALPFGTRVLSRGFTRLLAAVAPERGVAVLDDPSGISRIEAEVRAYLADPLVFQRPIPARLGATALAAGAEIERGLAAWRAPTLAFHGEADTYTSPQGSARLIAGIASADKELMLVPDGRHELLNDLAQEEVLARVLGWLDARGELPLEE